jgi:hypothetical protein
MTTSLHRDEVRRLAADGAQLVEATTAELCVVVSASGVLDQPALAGDEDALASEPMQLGPAAVRADEELAGLLEQMHERGLPSTLLTDPDRRLLAPAPLRCKRCYGRETR